MIKRRKVLITGFRPFLEEKINPSEILLTEVCKEFGEQVDTLLLPVSFEFAFEDLRTYLKANSFDIVLLLGQAGGRSKIGFERVGLNWIETSFPDENKFIPVQGSIDKDGEPALFTDLPLSRWLTDLRDLEVPVEISLSAGGYVCNYVYYQTLHWFKIMNRPEAVCFIHVPFLPEQVHDKPGVPFMALSEMTSVLFRVIRWHI